MKYVFTFLFFLQWVLCLTSVESFAQATDINRSALYWTRYYQEWAITEKFQLHTEIDNRRFFQPSKQFQTIARTTFVMKLPDEIKLGLGISYSLGFSDLSSLVVPEIRPHQQIEAEHGKSRLKFDHRIRVEQPFVRDTVREELQSSYDFTLRGRYRFRLVYTVKDKNEKGGHMALQWSNEIILKMQQEEAFDQYILYGGINYYLTPTARLDVGYMKYFEREYQNDVLFNYDIIRLTVRLFL